MDLRKLRACFPDLILIGNINSTDVAMLSREEIVAQTLDCVEFAKETTGVIVGTSNCFVTGTPMENVMAVLETIAENR
jgi:uroporphyrinogen-III decarboxylase